ncbi:zinc finger protein 189-like [Mauremys mutica]|uniref:zinc finger protein 189-like n=1 Tax=Mauremys mutica TaxID=74926 RepID=UPI001D1663A2|nr:zinc finger protein 189-like [Mauremys mutica]
MGERPYPCTDCGKSFWQKKLLIIHQCIHPEEQPSTGLHCGKIFYQKSGLNKHQRVHGADMASQWAQCGRDIGKTQGVPIHQAPYRSPECSIDLGQIIHPWDMIHHYSDSRRGFGKELKLIRPREHHAAKRLFTGTEYGNSFKQSDHLLSHQQIHALGKPPHLQPVRKDLTNGYV